MEVMAANSRQWASRLSLASNSVARNRLVARKPAPLVHNADFERRQPRFVVSRRRPANKRRSSDVSVVDGAATQEPEVQNSTPSAVQDGAVLEHGANGASLSIELAEEASRRMKVPPTLEVDSYAEEQLKAVGAKSARRTKLICTIGPSSCSPEQLEEMAHTGMNVVRLNMCHGTHEWHRQVISHVKQLNREKGYSIAIMMDTEGSEIHFGELESPRQASDAEEWTFTIRKFRSFPPEKTIQVNYEGFIDDVRPGDQIVVDGGMVRFEVTNLLGPDVVARCVDPGLLLPRANITLWRGPTIIRARNSLLPTLSSKDWIDIDFGIAEGVDFIAVSFVKGPDVIKHLKSYIESRIPNRTLHVVAKIESRDSLRFLPEIIEAADGAMVARGDLGAQVPLEQVPSVQKEVVRLCRSANKPVIVASQLLQSMITYPTPTRAEVADISEAVRQRTDALMLSAESAAGAYPVKCLEVLCTVAARIERWTREEPHRQQEILRLPELGTTLADRISEEICNSASAMADKLQASAIFVYTRRGYMASLLSRNRPDCPIFAFTDSQSVRRRLSLYWGLIPFRMPFSDDLDTTIERTFTLLLERSMLKAGNVVVVVSDVVSSLGTDQQSVQVRRVPAAE